MNEHRDRWLTRVVGASLTYFAAGIIFGALAGAAGPTPARTLWRATAFLVSGVVYVAHLAAEWRSRRVLASSLHVALAVAIGAFALALSANIHSLFVASSNRLLLRASVLIWPVMTALPAFVVAFAATTLGNRLGRRTDEGAAPRPGT